MNFRGRCVAVLLGLAVCAGAARSQQIQMDAPQIGAPRPPMGKGHVLLLADAIEVEAGKPQTVELRFRVDPGFHINSHHPKDELLIPTVLKLDEDAGMKLLEEQYPAGSAFRLAVGDGETLDVYQGEFRVSLRVVAPRGSSTLTGTLRYQACDNAACYPPRTLPVKVLVTAK